MSLDSVRQFLSSHAPDLVILETTERTATVAEAAAVHGVATGQIAKTLSLWMGQEPVLLVLGGDARIDNAKFKARFKTKARMLDAQEVEHWTGHPVGGVCPFGLAHPLKVYADESLRAFDEVVPAAGSPHSALRLTVRRLAELTDAEWVDVAQEAARQAAQPGPQSSPQPSPQSSPHLAQLSTLVVKDGVSLGLLPVPQRALALSVAALRLGAQEEGSGDPGVGEPEVNERLRACLQAECAFLSTDHVELRRWLVDAGLWQRDDFGRGYRATPAHQWPQAVAEAAAAVASLGDAASVRAWVAERREQQRAARQARRQVWQQGQVPAQASDPNPP